MDTTVIGQEVHLDGEILAGEAEVQAQLSGPLEFTRRARGAECRSSRGMGKLNGGRPYTTSSSVNQYTLAHLQACLRK